MGGAPSKNCLSGSEDIRKCPGTQGASREIPGWPNPSFERILNAFAQNHTQLSQACLLTVLIIVTNMVVDGWSVMVNFAVSCLSNLVFLVEVPPFAIFISSYKFASRRDFFWSLCIDEKGAIGLLDEQIDVCARYATYPQCVVALKTCKSEEKESFIGLQGG